MSLISTAPDLTAIPESFLGLPVSVLVDDNMQSMVTRPGEAEYEPPQGLTRGFFDAGNGLTLSYYYTTETNLDNARVSAVGLSGFKSDLVLNPKDIGYLIKRNIPLAWLAINNPERGLDFLDDTKRACSMFLTNPPEPVKEIINSRIPTGLTGHSTGLQLTIEAANDPSYYSFLADTFCGIVGQSPMLETAPLFNALPAKLQSKVFDFVASKHPTSLPGEFGLGKIWSWVSGVKNLLGPDMIHACPTVGQSEIIRNNARERILNTVGPHLLAKGDLPVAFFIGGQDKFADPTTTIEFAKRIGAGIFYDENAQHAPICQNPRNMVNFIKTLHEMANKTFDPSAHQMPEKLGRSFAFSTVQSAARLLNSATGPLKRFL